MDLRERALGQDVRRHPWELCRARFFIDVLERSGALAGATTVLDAGSGDAFFATELAHARAGLRRLVCWDEEYGPDSRALLGLDEPRLELTRDRPLERFPVIVALDVLEHVDDDRQFLGDLVANNLGAGGWVLVSVPAWPALATHHDRLLRHHRRYTPTTLAELVRAAGLASVCGGGLFHSLIAPRVLSVMRDRLRAQQSDDLDPLEWNGGRTVTGAVTAALRADNWLSARLATHGVQLPGLSQWSLCRVAPVSGSRR